MSSQNNYIVFFDETASGLGQILSTGINQRLLIDEVFSIFHYIIILFILSMPFIFLIWNCHVSELIVSEDLRLSSLHFLASFVKNKRGKRKIRFSCSFLVHSQRIERKEIRSSSLKYMDWYGLGLLVIWYMCISENFGFSPLFARFSE